MAVLPPLTCIVPPVIFRLSVLRMTRPALVAAPVLQMFTVPVELMTLLVPPAVKAFPLLVLKLLVPLRRCW